MPFIAYTYTNGIPVKIREVATIPAVNDPTVMYHPADDWDDWCALCTTGPAYPPDKITEDQFNHRAVQPEGRMNERDVEWC